MVNEETGILEEIISRIASISEASEKVLLSLETQKNPDDLFTERHRFLFFI